MNPAPEIVAHRGYAGRYPENTLSALEAAARCGARYVEIDVQLSADSVPVLFHDRTLERICGVAGAVHEKTHAQLRALRASEPGRFGDRYAHEPIASLEDLRDFLFRHAGIVAFVEAKRVAIERFGADAVLRTITDTLAQVRERCVLISFSLAFLREARKQKTHAIAAVIDRWDEGNNPELTSLAPEYLFCDIDGLPQQGRLSGPGASKTVIYEVPDGPTARKLAARGVEFIETFAVCDLLDEFRSTSSLPT